jgi:hypothetical protein
VVAIMQFSVAFYYFALLTTKYSPQHHVFKHQSVGKRLTLSSLAYFLYPEDGGEMLLLNVVFTRSTRRHIPEDVILLCFCLWY